MMRLDGIRESQVTNYSPTLDMHFKVDLPTLQTEL